MGPIASPTWLNPTLSPMKSGCRLVGSTAAMVVRAPLDTPAAPTPEMTRPTMNMGEDWAAPHIADPTSKMTKKVRKVHYMIIEVRMDLAVTGRGG